MEIHKPRSVHSFREFLSELGVVVLGIVIALGGEQLIEHMRDNHKASEARTGIRDEIGMNIAVLLSRSSTQSCIDQRIDEIGRLLDASDGANYVVPLWLGRPQIWEMLHARWQVVSQAGRAPLLAPERLRLRLRSVRRRGCRRRSRTNCVGAAEGYRGTAASKRGNEG